MEIQIFETILILDGRISEEAYENASHSFRNLIEHLPSRRIKTEKLGKKTLAYETHGRSEGYYLVFTYESTQDLIRTKLEPALRKDDVIIKYITLPCEKEYYPDSDEEVNNRIK